MEGLFGIISPPFAQSHKRNPSRLARELPLRFTGYKAASKEWSNTSYTTWSYMVGKEGIAPHPSLSSLVMT